MKLKFLGSSSAGNCYVFTDSKGSSLVVECGLSFKRIMAAVDFKLHSVVGVLVTHEHGDHCNGVREASFRGLNVYASEGTINAIVNKIDDINMHRLNPVKAGKKFTLGEFSIMPFDVQHDAAEPLGFLIKHEECGLTLFLTDTNYSKYIFSGLNNIIVEANYGEAILNDRLFTGSLHAGLRNRVTKSHMSIETTLQLLKSNDLSNVNNIVLVHLSDGNSNEREFIQRVQSIAPMCNIVAADKGMAIDFNKEIF